MSRNAFTMSVINWCGNGEHWFQVMMALVDQGKERARTSITNLSLEDKWKVHTARVMEQYFKDKGSDAGILLLEKAVGFDQVMSDMITIGLEEVEWIEVAEYFLDMGEDDLPQEGQ